MLCYVLVAVVAGMLLHKDNVCVVGLKGGLRHRLPRSRQCYSIVLTANIIA